MSAIEQRAREIYAAQFPGDCGYDTRKWIMEGTWGDDEVIAAIIAALAPPEGFVLVPVEPTEAMLRVGYSWMMGRIVMRNLYDELLAARPEAP